MARSTGLQGPAPWGCPPKNTQKSTLGGLLPAWELRSPPAPGTAPSLGTASRPCREGLTASPGQRDGGTLRKDLALPQIPVPRAGRVSVLNGGIRHALPASRHGASRHRPPENRPDEEFNTQRALAAPAPPANRLWGWLKTPEFPALPEQMHFAL